MAPPMIRQWFHHALLGHQPNLGTGNWTHYAARPQARKALPSTCSLFFSIVFQSLAEALYSVMAWTHLVRFESKGKTYYGDAIFPDGSDPTDVVSIATGGQLRARILHGDPLSTDSTSTDDIVAVEKLVAPLTRAQVPIIRCIGLNYMKHSTFVAKGPAEKKSWLRADFAICSSGGWSYTTAVSLFVHQASNVVGSV